MTTSNPCTRTFSFLFFLFTPSCLSWSGCSMLVQGLATASAGSPALPNLDKVVRHANSFASAHGIQIEKLNDSGSSSYECAPISLLPNAYPKEAFAKAKSLASPFNELVDRISRDGEFLETTLGAGVSEADPFTGKLLDLYREIYLTGTDAGKFARKADRLGIQRSDYMLNTNKGSDYQLKQVELNTIASSFAGLAVNVAALHRHLISRFADNVEPFLLRNKDAVVGSDRNDESRDGVPENPALICLPMAMNVAHEQYKKRFESETPAILFVVQDGETNTVDQRMIEFRLWDTHGIPVVRMSLTDAHTELELEETTGALYIRGDDSEKRKRQEISVVYFRAGYAPMDYPNGYEGIEWKSRETIERSRATKCPSLGFHLAGTKKVQQELARPGTLERFFPGEDETPVVDSMRSVFAGLYSLGVDATDVDISSVQDVLNGKEGQYVLKPQREGGGYNFYGTSLANKLRANLEETESGNIKLGAELAEFILMERLFPPQQEAILLRSGRVEDSGESISELGCFGTIVTTHDGDVLHNEYGGFLLRTKFSNVDEGGVASGFATLSSPYLC